MGLSPFYTIHQYRPDFYKVVAFKCVRDPDAAFLRSDDHRKNDVKLDNNFSRARSMVLQYALCNPWDYFFTGTIDRAKLDRYDLDTFASRLMQFIRDKRKKYRAKFQVLLVPERHQDGAWHIHGLVYGLPPEVLCPFAPPAPRHLIDGGFLNWPDYMNKFGWCSLAPIRDPIATAYYITKYISKDIGQRSGDLGKHLYFHSRPLSKAEPVSDVYMYDSRLENYCVNDYEFCKTGMVANAPWYFPVEWDYSELRSDGPRPIPLPDPLASFDPGSIDPFYEQLPIPGFCVSSSS